MRPAPAKPVLVAVAATVAVAVMFAPGCVSHGTRSGGSVSFTPVESASKWMTPLSLPPADPEVVLAVVDFDFSGREVAMQYTACAYAPGDSSAMELKALDRGVRAATIRQLAEAMAKRSNGGAFAMVLLAGGRPIGEPGASTPKALRDFLAAFDSDLRLAGANPAYIVPTSGVSVAPFGETGERRK